MRLCIGGIVLLVVPEAPVPDEVDDEVVAELGAIREPKSYRRKGRLGIVRVDVDDRHVESLREVARVSRRPALSRVRRVTDLVVGDHMQRPACRVPLERLEIERLGDDALPRERRVSMDEHRQGNGWVVDPGS